MGKSGFLSGVLFGAIIFILLHYHFVGFSKNKVGLIVYPKNTLSFSKTFISINDWKPADYWNNKDILGVLGSTALNAAIGVFSAEKSKDGSLLIDQLDSNGFICNLTDNSIFCVKI